MNFHICFQRSMMFNGGSSLSISAFHIFCIISFAAIGIEENHPNGSNIVIIFETRICFIITMVVNLDWSLNP